MECRMRVRLMGLELAVGTAQLINELSGREATL